MLPIAHTAGKEKEERQLEPHHKPPAWGPSQLSQHPPAGIYGLSHLCCLISSLTYKWFLLSLRDEAIIRKYILVVQVGDLFCCCPSLFGGGRVWVWSLPLTHTQISPNLPFPVPGRDATPSEPVLVSVTPPGPRWFAEGDVPPVQSRTICLHVRGKLHPVSDTRLSLPAASCFSEADPSQDSSLDQLWVPPTLCLASLEVSPKQPGVWWRLKPKSLRF